MSLSLQANWLGRALYLWARPGGGPAAAPAGDPERLRELVSDLAADPLLASAVPQGALRVDLPGPEGTATAAEVPALVFSPAEAIDLLTGVPCNPTGACGASLAYWATLARFVCALMAHRQFVPRVDEEPDLAAGPGQTRLVASWRVLISDRAQLQWLERVAGAMPPVCLAATPVTASIAPGAPAPGAPEPERPTDPTPLVETFLAATADALVRRAVADDPFFRRAQDRAAAPGAAADVRWLAALLGPDRTIHVDDFDEAAAFVQQAHAWLGQLDDTQAAPLRLVFVLGEPPEVEDDEDVEAAFDGDAARTHDGETGGAHDAEMGGWGDGEQQPGGADAAPNDPSSTLHPPSSPGGAPHLPIPPSAHQSSETPEYWPLTLHLQGLDGEGELIDAASLWGSPQAGAPILGRRIARRQAALLAELSRAAEVFPPAQTLLAHRAPARLDLGTPDAHAFMRHWAPILRERGFGVVLPEWAGRGDDAIGLRLLLSPEDAADPDAPGVAGLLGLGAAAPTGRRPDRAAVADNFEFSTGHFGLDTLVHFNWQVAVGDLRLTPEQFERLVDRNQPLVKFRGRWINLDLEATRKAVEFVRRRPTGRINLADAFRTAFTAHRGETGLNVIGLSGTSWLESLLDQAPVKAIERLAQPPSFKGELRPYQLRGLHWLLFLHRIGLGACLADDMGLGKTIQLIALMLLEREGMGAGGDESDEREGSGFRVQGSAAAGNGRSRPGPTLLFAPTSVVGNWLRELQRFAPTLRVLVHHGPERPSGDAFARAATDADVVLTSYSLAHRDRDDLARVRWHRLALDEAQKIKNPAAAATAAIRALYAPHRVALTGTPIENHLSELWSIMHVLNPGLLGTAADFREKFAVPIEKLGERDRAEQLRRMIRPFVLRRTKADPAIAGDLPEKLEMKVFCNLTAEQAALYERLVNESLGQIDAATGIRRRGLILATLTRLKQICNHPALVEQALARQRPGAAPPADASLDYRSGKAERLIDMLEELFEEGDAALVFTQYREMGHLLERLVQQRLREPTFFLHGGTPAAARDQMIQAFQAREKGTPRIFLLSLRAGGLGLNLTAANHVFHFDRWWNPAVEAQATDRAHRVGQTRTVQVHKFVCIGTMEERIDRLLTEKQALADQIVGSGDEWLTGLSTDQLREYLTLSKEAVGEFE